MSLYRFFPQKLSAAAIFKSTYTFILYVCVAQCDKKSMDGCRRKRLHLKTRLICQYKSCLILRVHPLNPCRYSYSKTVQFVVQSSSQYEPSIPIWNLKENPYIATHFIAWLQTVVPYSIKIWKVQHVSDKIYLLQSQHVVELLRILYRSFRNHIYLTFS